MYYKIIIIYNFMQFYLILLLQQIIIVLHFVALKLFMDYNISYKPSVDWNDHISTDQQVCLKKIFC